MAGVISEPAERAPDLPAERWPFVRGARASITFLTRVPVGGFPFGPAAWRWASAWFPAVGALLGLATGLVFQLTTPAGAFVAAATAITVSLLLTGAFHEDGLADTADALGGAYDRAKIFVILKDSRIGTFGAAALCMSLLLRVGLVARLDTLAPFALVVGGALSRVPPVWMLARLPYVTAADESRSRVVARAGWPQVIVASCFGLAALAAVASERGLPAALAIVVGLVAVAGLCTWRFLARAGGITGDFLGTTQQTCEVATLLILALTAAW